MREHDCQQGVVWCVGMGVVWSELMYLYRYGRMTLQVQAFYIFGTGVLTYMYVHSYKRSTFTFLSDVPYILTVAI